MKFLKIPEQESIENIAKSIVDAFIALLMNQEDLL